MACKLMRVTDVAEAVTAVVVVAQPCGGVRTYFLSPTLRVDDIASCGCAARWRVHLVADSWGRVVFVMIPQRNCYAQMPVSRARMVSSSEVAHFGEVPCCPIPPSFCYLALRAV